MMRYHVLVEEVFKKACEIGKTLACVGERPHDRAAESATRNDEKRTGWFTIRASGGEQQPEYEPGAPRDMSTVQTPQPKTVALKRCEDEDKNNCSMTQATRERTGVLLDEVLSRSDKALSRVAAEITDQIKRLGVNGLTVVDDTDNTPVIALYSRPCKDVNIRA